MERGYIIEDDRILRRLYLQLIIANVLIGLVLPFNQFVDSMLTGKGLGSEALQSFALFLPIGALVTALSSFFSIGTQITCSHMLGNGRFRETGKLIQTALLSAFVFSLLFAAVLFLRSSQIAKLLGADGDFSGRIQDIEAYLQGYAPGIPVILLVGIMMSLLQLEGKKKLVILLSLCIFFINGAGDLANIFLFKKGLFGMAAATATSYIIVFFILLNYFLVRSKMFRFSLAGFQKKDLMSIIKNGLPSMSYYGSIVIRAAFLNWLILTMLDGIDLEIMLVINSFMTIVDAAIGGMGDATLLLGGVLYGQKDIKGQRKLLKTALITGAFMFLAITVLTLLLAPSIAGLFSEHRDSVFIAAAARAIRLTATCFIVSDLSCILKKYIQSVGRARYTSVSNLLCNILYACSAAWILVKIFGSDGLFVSFAVCFTLVLITHVIYAHLLSCRSGRTGFDRLLFLPENFEVTDKDQWVYSIKDIDGCITASRQMTDLCRERGMDKKKAYFLSLCTEEITTNVVEHGFRTGKNSVIVVKLLFLEDRIILNILDNCPFFDPTCYYDRIKGDIDPLSGIGVRLVMKLAKEIIYTNSFNLNNLMIVI